MKKTGSFEREANRYFRRLFGPDYWRYDFDKKGKLLQMVPLMEENIDGDTSVPYDTVYFGKDIAADEDSDVRNADM